MCKLLLKKYRAADCFIWGICLGLFCSQSLQAKAVVSEQLFEKSEYLENQPMKNKYLKFKIILTSLFFWSRIE